MDWIIGIIWFFFILLCWALWPREPWPERVLDELIRLEDERNAIQSSVIEDGSDSPRDTEREDFLGARILKLRQDIANFAYIDSIDDVDVMIRNRRVELEAEEN